MSTSFSIEVNKKNQQAHTHKHEQVLRATNDRFILTFINELYKSSVVYFFFSKKYLLQQQAGYTRFDVFHVVSIVKNCVCSENL